MNTVRKLTALLTVGMLIGALNMQAGPEQDVLFSQFSSKCVQAETSFDGTNYFDTRFTKIHSDQVSVSLYFKTDSTAIDPILLGCDGDNRLQIALNFDDHVGRMRFYVKQNNSKLMDARLDTGTTLLDDRWHHLVILADFSQETVSFILDGQAETVTISSSNTGTLTQLSNPLYIAANNRGDIPSQSTGETVTNLFDGDIASVRIYDRILTAAEWQALYTSMK